jgi:hypothetical protein
MCLRKAFLVVGLAFTMVGGAFANDQFSDDVTFSREQMAELPVGVVIGEASEPSFVEDQGLLAAIEAAAAAEWAMLDAGGPVVVMTESGSIDTYPSAMAGEPADFQPTLDSDQAMSPDRTQDLRAVLNAREAQVQSA